MPASAITSQIRSRSSGSPWPEPYCRAIGAALGDELVPSTSATASSGSAAMYGMPPASETTSGRLATANEGPDLRGGHARGSGAA